MDVLTELLVSVDTEQDIEFAVVALAAGIAGPAADAPSFPVVGKCRVNNGKGNGSTGACRAAIAKLSAFKAPADDASCSSLTDKMGEAVDLRKVVLDACETEHLSDVDVGLPIRQVNDVSFTVRGDCPHGDVDTPDGICCSPECQVVRFDGGRVTYMPGRCMYGTYDTLETSVDPTRGPLACADPQWASVTKSCPSGQTCCGVISCFDRHGKVGGLCTRVDNDRIGSTCEDHMFSGRLAHEKGSACKNAANEAVCCASDSATKLASSFQRDHPNLNSEGIDSAAKFKDSTQKLSSSAVRVAVHWIGTVLVLMLISMFMV